MICGWMECCVFILNVEKLGSAEVGRGLAHKASLFSEVIPHLPMWTWA